jgi:hypothetical protein
MEQYIINDNVSDITYPSGVSSFKVSFRDPE